MDGSSVSRRIWSLLHVPTVFVELFYRKMSVMQITPALLLLLAVAGVESRCSGRCIAEECRELPVECPAGMKLDLCGCCYVCARAEGERCTVKSEAVRGNGDPRGVCGDGMECRPRSDLADGDAPEAVCYCSETEQACGTDGRTYDNLCRLNEQRYRSRNGGLLRASRGPCAGPPLIISTPESVQNYTKSNVVLSCEASGNPVPYIEWEVSKSGKTKSIRLPSDDQHTAVQSRGGPKQYEVTSWLQLREIILDDEGDYTCIAINSWGQTRASATVKVVNAQYRRGNYEYNRV